MINSNVEQAPSKEEIEKIQAQLKALTSTGEQKMTTPIIKGYDFNQGVDYQKLLESYSTLGFQSVNLAHAIKIVNRMIHWRLSDDPISEYDSDEYLDPKVREKTRCTIFLGYTSNMVSCGIRDIIRYLVQHKMVDCLVTTAGGIEEDFLKCLGNFHLGSFTLNDWELRKNCKARIGNILVGHENYEKFEDWVTPLFFEMNKEQKKSGKIWSPSQLIKLMGERINNPDSIYYWAAKNDIPVYCPAITDGAIGDMLFSNSYKNSGLILDLIQDISAINKLALKAKKSGVIILGGGIIKHHIMNANIWRNGADFGVFINTGVYYDGSDSGAKATEAITWGKLRLDSDFVKVFSEATLVFPLLVAETFAKNFKQAARTPQKEEKEANSTEEAQH